MSSHRQVEAILVERRLDGMRVTGCWKIVDASNAAGEPAVFTWRVTATGSDGTQLEFDSLAPVLLDSEVLGRFVYEEVR
jgi:hypothetical protein